VAPENVEVERMMGTLRKLFGAACVFALGSVASFYFGSRLSAAAPPPPPADALGRHFSGDPGDGWMLFGLFLLVVALAVAGAGAMLWRQERQ
jgi:hypothetical protein